MKGFTIIELLVVLAISALFSTLAIAYSSVGRNANELTIEEAKISQFILQAKALSVNTYSAPGSNSCGFGVVFDLSPTAPALQTYSIFSYDPGPGDPSCPTANSIANISSAEELPYTSGTWQLPVSTGVVLKSQDHSDGLVTILFYPPEPTVFLSSDGTSFTSSVNALKVYLQTVDGNNSETLSVNTEGQITF